MLDFDDFAEDDIPDFSLFNRTRVKTYRMAGETVQPCHCCGSDHNAKSLGFEAYNVSISDCELLREYGLDHSGTYWYVCPPVETCCKKFSIRIDATKNVPRKSHNKIQKRWFQYLCGDPHWASKVAEEKTKNDDHMTNVKIKNHAALEIKTQAELMIEEQKDQDHAGVDESIEPKDLDSEATTQMTLGEPDNPIVEPKADMPELNPNIEHEDFMATPLLKKFDSELANLEKKKSQQSHHVNESPIKIKSESDLLVSKLNNFLVGNASLTSSILALLRPPAKDFFETDKLAKLIKVSKSKQTSRELSFNSKPLPHKKSYQNSP
jgi:hypothetical protein